MITDRLYDEAVAKSPVCVGLDTDMRYLPACIGQSGASVENKLFAFNKAIVDETRDIACCYKLQIACYEAEGLAGLGAFARTLEYVRKGGSIAITDAKRGDIASTARQYARAHFTGEFECDMLTVNAYMGEDAVSPYYEYLDKKGLFVLVKTSNPTSGEFEDIDAGGMPLYERVAEGVSRWGEAFVGGRGFSAIGAVTGCTYPAQFNGIKQKMPHTFFLIPGYGAQGGTGKDVAEFFKDGICGTVNSSRGIICAHKGKSEDEDFALYAREAALAMKEDINKWL